MRRSVFVAVASVVAGWCAVAAHGQTGERPEAPAKEQSDRDRSPIAAPAGEEPPAPEPPSAIELGVRKRFGSRLGTLTPDKPRAYFELAEEMVQEAPRSEATQDVAREAAALAFELWREGPARQSDPRLGPSSLTFLASLAERGEDETWLRALAAGSDAEGLLEAGESAAIGAVDESGAIDAVSAIEFIRAGEGRRAAKLLDKPEVKELMLRYERLLSPANITGEADQLRQLASKWPRCSECSNRRFVRRPEGIRICPTCLGDPGPQISQLQLLYQLRFEATLLRGAQKSWVAQTLVDGGRPLRDVNEEEVGEFFGVDASRPLWREGAWVGEGGEAPASPEDDAAESAEPVEAPAASPLAPAGAVER